MNEEGKYNVTGALLHINTLSFNSQIPILFILHQIFDCAEL